MRTRSARPPAGLVETILDERGATSVEYGLMVAFVAAAVVGAVSLLGVTVAGGFAGFVALLPA